MRNLENKMKWHWVFSHVLTFVFAGISLVLGMVLLILAKKFSFDGPKFYYVVGGCYSLIIACYPLFIRPSLCGSGKRSGLLSSLQFAIYAAFAILFGPKILDSIVINNMKLINARLVALAIAAVFLILGVLNYIYYRLRKEMFTL